MSAGRPWRGLCSPKLLITQTSTDRLARDSRFQILGPRAWKPKELRLPMQAQQLLSRQRHYMLLLGCEDATVICMHRAAERCPKAASETTPKIATAA